MFKLSACDRLSRWRSFRLLLDSLPLDNAVEKANDLWATCPFTPYYLDPLQPEQWPNPWDLIIENCYCDLAKVLGLVYTLHLTKHSALLFPEIHVYFDNKTKHTYHIAYLCKGKYVLNLAEGEIVNKQHINQDFVLKHCYTASDLKLEQY